MNRCDAEPPFSRAKARAIVEKSPLHSSSFQRPVQAIPVLDHLCVLVVTDPDHVPLQLRVASECNGFDVPLDLVLKAIIGAERCAS